MGLWPTVRCTYRRFVTHITEFSFKIKPKAMYYFFFFFYEPATPQDLPFSPTRPSPDLGAPRAPPPRASGPAFPFVQGALPPRHRRAETPPPRVSPPAIAGTGRPPRSASPPRRRHV